MDVIDALKHGHKAVLQTVEDLPKSEWETPSVVGVWSVKEIIAHLASHELLLLEILTTLSSDVATPCLDMMREDSLRFNDMQVNLRKDKTSDEVLAEYKDTHERVMALIVQIPKEMRRNSDKTFLWSGMDYNLEEIIIYTNFAHKKEHCAQIGVFRDQLAR